MSRTGSAVTDPRTIGEFLRAARRKRRTSIERAAEETRIRADYLMRMESDELDFLAPAYVRGFLRSYARFLGLAPDPLLKEFDRRFGTDRPEPGQIAALERRAKRAPKQRSKTRPWTVAAWLAALGLLALGIIGVVSGPERSTPGRRVTQTGTDEGAPRGTESPEPSPTPRESRPPKRDVIAFRDGIELEIVAVRADCWVDVTADGTRVYTSNPPLAVGQRAGPFRADESMDVVLGNAYGVDLIVNGRRLGPMGEEGQVITISLPEDIKSLL
jgi:cytoskeleton protein RodZ